MHRTSCVCLRCDWVISCSLIVCVQAAQEREELQRDGDCLDARICKAEKEIRALENTLHVVGSRNELYRKSFSKITESSRSCLETNQSLSLSV